MAATQTATESRPRSPSDDRIRIACVHHSTPILVTNLAELAEALRNPEAKVWVDLTRPTVDTATEVGALLGIHPLIVEDILEQNQRAKIEFIDDDVHVVLFALAYQGGLESWEIDFVLGSRFLLSVHDGNWDPARAHQLRGGVEPLLARGPDYLLYALSDSLVDNYFPVIDRLGDDVDALQDDVLTDPSSWPLQRLFTLKRELIDLRRVTSPAREVFNQLTDRDLPNVRREHVIFFRDVYDHLLRVTDELDTYRELVAGTLDMYLTVVNNNLSQIMKRLTGVTVILAGVGAVAGIFGMSEAGAAFAGDEAAGFWMVTGAVVVVAALVAVVLRRIDWI